MFKKFLTKHKTYCHPKSKSRWRDNIFEPLTHHLLRSTKVFIGQQKHSQIFKLKYDSQKHFGKINF